MGCTEVRENEVLLGNGEIEMYSERVVLTTSCFRGCRDSDRSDTRKPRSRRPNFLTYEDLKQREAMWLLPIKVLVYKDFVLESSGRYRRCYATGLLTIRTPSCT